MNFPALDLDNPQTQFWLGLGSGLMQAGGPSATPVGIFQGLGQGVQSGMNQYALAKKGQQEGELANLHAALYKAQAGKLQQDAARAQEFSQLSTMPLQSGGGATPGGPWSPQYAQANTPSPADELRARGTLMLNRGFKEGHDYIKAGNDLDNNLEMKDGVWYDKRTGAPVRGGHAVNQQGFGSAFNVGQNGEITMAPLGGSDARFRQQQRIGEEEKARTDLVITPPTSPTAAPTYNNRLNVLQNGGAAGMSPAAASTQAADAAQQMDIAKQQAAMYTGLQNAAMSNPAKIGNLKQIGSLLEGFEGGKLSGAGLELARAANSVGVKIDPRLPNKEAAEALTNQISLTLRSTANGEGMPGAMSDKDREFLKAMTPQMAQTNEGRRKIIDSRVKVLERENQVAKMARLYRQKYGRIDDNFTNQLQSWADAHPLFQ